MKYKLKEKLEEKEKGIIETLNNHQAETKEQFVELNENIKHLEQVI